MSVWSIQRRIYIYLTVLIIVSFVITGFLFFTLHNPPSCTDGIQNTSETGIDCGGDCPQACPVQPKKLLDVWTRIFPVIDGIYTAVAYIENQNETLYVPSVQFEITLHDQNGSIIARSSERTVIQQNGVTPIFVPFIATGEIEAVEASFRFVDEPQFVPAEASRMFAITDVVFEASDTGQPELHAVATNTGTRAVRDTDFVVIIYDEDGIAIAASRTFEEDMQPGESRNLHYTWVRPFSLRQVPCETGTCVRNIKRTEIVPVVVQW